MEGSINLSEDYKAKYQEKLEVSFALTKNKHFL